MTMMIWTLSPWRAAAEAEIPDTREAIYQFFIQVQEYCKRPSVFNNYDMYSVCVYEECTF